MDAYAQRMAVGGQGPGQASQPPPDRLSLHPQQPFFVSHTLGEDSSAAVTVRQPPPPSLPLLLFEVPLVDSLPRLSPSPSCLSSPSYLVMLPPTPCVWHHLTTVMYSITLRLHLPGLSSDSEATVHDNLTTCFLELIYHQRRASPRTGCGCVPALPLLLHLPNTAAVE